MEEITLRVELWQESGWLIATWEAAEGGGITTQGKDLRDLQQQVQNAVRCHFDAGDVPRRIRFSKRPILPAVF